jgi:hypothetical protein
MLPSYHRKTHFKAATGLQMQAEKSLIAPDKMLRRFFHLNQNEINNDDFDDSMISKNE